MVLPQLDEKDVKKLEDAMDAMEATLPELKSFILPGGDELNAFAHIARCVCRRAERAIAALHENEPVDAIILKYVNRLSDYLFMLARKFSHDHHKEEVALEAPRVKDFRACFSFRILFRIKYFAICLINIFLRKI